MAHLLWLFLLLTEQVGPTQPTEQDGVGIGGGLTVGPLTSLVDRAIQAWINATSTGLSLAWGPGPS